MIYLGNRKLYEDIIFIIARNVKSLVEHLNCQSLNESAGHNDLLSDFMYETGCNVRGYLKSLNERQKWSEESIKKFVEDNDIKTRKELLTKAGGAYDAALKFGLLNDLFGEKELKWTEESIRQFVKDNNIKTRKELKTKAIGAYNAALKFGILDDLFGERVAHNKKWTEESIRQFVKDNNIKTRNELKTKAISAYVAALKFGIINDLFGEKELKWKWTEEYIRQFVKDNNIKTRSELATKAGGAYDAAKQLGILDDLFGENKNKPSNYWTKEKCAELAAKCKYRSDFMRQYPSAYSTARNHGWLEDITKHMPKQKGYVLVSNHNYIVYVYEDIENKAAYVGLTNNIKRRDWEHRFPTSSGYDKLGLWCIEHDIPVPKPKILENNLTAKEAGEKEEEYWYKYRDEGWTMINTEKALGNLGGSSRKWTEKTIRQFVKDNNIKTRKELQTKAQSAYDAARRLGILDDLFGEKKPKWTEEYIRQFMKDNNIKTRSELEVKAKTAYAVALKIGLLNDLFGEKIQYNKKWTEESIRQFVKDNNIKTRNELLTKASGAYAVARQLGILDDLFGENKSKPLNYWTEESIKQFVKDNNIKTRNELYVKAQSAYDAAKRLGILNDLFGEKELKWTEESIRQFMKDNNIKTRSELGTKAMGAYDAAKRLGILDDLFGENKTKPKNYWTEESIRQFVKDNNIKTRKELYAKAQGAYEAARRLGILDDLFGEKKPKWTEESIRQFVKDNNIKTRKELYAKASSAYDTARQLGILNDLFGEKELKWTEESIRQFVKDNNIKTRNDLWIKAGGAYDAARRLGILDDLFGEKKPKWTEEYIRQFMKDNNIKTRSELATKATRAYDAAKRLGILYKLFPKNN